MRSSAVEPRTGPRTGKQNWAKTRARVFLLGLALLCSSPVILGQDNGSTVAVDRAMLQQMLQRIEQLETRVKQLESDKERVTPVRLVAAAATAHPVEATMPLSPNPTPTLIPSAISSSTPAPSPSPLNTAAPTLIAAVQPPVPPPMPGVPARQSPSTAAQEAEQAQLENPMADRMDMSKTLMRIRGFGDISLLGGTQDAVPAQNLPAQTTSFALGELDLFITSDISDKFKFLTELVFEAGPDNIYGVQRGIPNAFKVEPERYLIQYSYNDYFNISAGRWHTAIGYYNTAYHHSTWFQTTTGRPFLFAFEDEGGILPTHTVGASATGLIPSGALGLHYVVEAGNGRASRDPLSEEPVQNEVDDQNHKAVNLALYARPESLRGLQTGFSVYRDVLSPQNSPRVGETIMALHAVLERPKYEWLNEVVVVRHSIMGANKVYNTPGFYTQLSRQFGSFRPYFRYQYVNVARTEPIFPDVGLQHGPTAGVRFDASEFVALKFQYDYTFQRQAPQSQPGFSTLTLQIGFTF